jgi:hypothetical protein
MLGYFRERKSRRRSVVASGAPRPIDDSAEVQHNDG